MGFVANSRWFLASNAQMTEFTAMLFGLVIAPSVLLLSLVVLPHWGAVHLAAHATAVAIYFAYVYLWGKYTLMGSYYLRFLLPILFIVAVAIAWRMRHSTSEHHPMFVWFLYAATLVGSVAVVYHAEPKLSTALGGLSYPSDQEYIDLIFPLHNGRYFIADGGSNRMMNIHYRLNTPAQKFAVDINKLDALGRVSRHFSSPSSADANIFGETVYSPCSGIVSDSLDGIPDHKIGDYDEAHPLGNHVVLECEGLFVEMAHFKNGSLRVHTGDAVNADSALAAVGNSGFSDEPHLHIQATRAALATQVSNGQGVPMKFLRRFLNRNDVIKVQ